MFEEYIAFINELRAEIHLVLHITLPLFIVCVFVRNQDKKRVFVWLMLTMLVDVDHLLATPVYAPDRCSILFHPLHQTGPMVIYALMVLWPISLWGLNKQMKSFEKTMGWLGLGLLLHMVLDGIDCWWMRLS